MRPPALQSLIGLQHGQDRIHLGAHLTEDIDQLRGSFGRRAVAPRARNRQATTANGTLAPAAHFMFSRP